MTQFDYRGSFDTSLSPYVLGIPTGFTMPAALAPMIAAYDEAFQLYDEASIAAELTRHTLTKSPEKDQQALIAALETGKSDPGGKHEATADRAALVADTRLRVTARALSVAAEAVENGIRAHRADILALAIDRERAQIAAVSEAWQEVTEQLATVTGRMSSTIGEHINFVLYVLGERTRIEPSRAELPTINPSVKNNTATLDALDRITHADALVE
jgi:hypothetical protein